MIKDLIEILKGNKNKSIMETIDNLHWTTVINEIPKFTFERFIYPLFGTFITFLSFSTALDFFNNNNPG